MFTGAILGMTGPAPAVAAGGAGGGGWAPLDDVTKVSPPPAAPSGLGPSWGLEEVSPPLTAAAAASVVPPFVRPATSFISLVDELLEEAGTRPGWRGVHF